MEKTVMVKLRREDLINIARYHGNVDWSCEVSGLVIHEEEGVPHIHVEFKCADFILCEQELQDEKEEETNKPTSK